MQPSPIYIREYESLQEIQKYNSSRLQQLAQALEDDVNLLDEETRIMANFISTSRERDGNIGGDDDRDFDDTHASTGGKRRGKSYRGKASEQKEQFLALEEKHTILAAEQERLKKERERCQVQAEDAKEVLHATMEEAQKRVKEIRLEMQYFAREVLDGRPDANPLTVSAADASIDAIIKYLHDRVDNKRVNSEKMLAKCKILQEQISKNNQNLKMKDDVGEAFHMIDFDQLKIENHQFLERIEQKNLELVDLKGTTTRTVQSLNKHMDKLNGLLQEQQHLQKEVQSREDFEKRLVTEMEQVTKDGQTARKKNEALKIQHEAVRVPKVEDYIAQKAEMLELEKAAQNWKRKVEIAAGHVAVMKQQMLSISKKQQTVLASSKPRLAW